MKKLFIILSLSAFTVSSNTQCIDPRNVLTHAGKVVAVMAAGTASVSCGTMAMMHLATDTLESIDSPAKQKSQKNKKIAYIYGLASVALATGAIAIMCAK